MIECPHCKNETMYWQSESIYDVETKELVTGYYKCYACGERKYEPSQHKPLED